jgi:AcrR family transcriptional regulator
MDKPPGQTNEQGKAAAPAARLPRTQRTRSDGATTRSLILEAARRRLCEVGYARLNVRDIARDAGVNHALIGYHFQGKQALVMAVLDDANQRLLERQTHMYRSDASARKKWQQACDFYEDDLQSGFVRLLMELMGASFNDQALRREFVPRLLAWQQVVEEAVTNVIQEAGLDLPVSSRAITAWIVWFWLGMEASMTLEIAEEHGHQREALDAVATLLKHVERGVRRKASKPRERAREESR